jgi:hypothetical protein
LSNQNGVQSLQCYIDTKRGRVHGQHFIHRGTGITASPRNNYTLVDHSIVSKWHGT